MDQVNTHTRRDEQPTSIIGIQEIELAVNSSPSSPSRHSTTLIFSEIEPPNGGYAWICAVCAFLVNAQTWGVNSSWSVFLAYFLANSTFQGATRFQMALIGGISISQCLFISPIITMVHRRFGLRFVMILGAILIAAALTSSSFASQIWHLFLTQGVLFGWGMGFLYLPALSALPAWFSSQRSLACGIAASGAGIGGLIYNLAAGWTVQNIGIAWSYRVFALIGLAINLVCAFLMKEYRALGPLEYSHRYLINIHEFKHPGLILIALWGMATEFGYITLLYSLPTYASFIHLSAQQGSIASAMLNLGLAVGHPLVGHLSDQYGRINVSMMMTGLCGIMCFTLWVPFTSYVPLLIFAILGGMVCGTFWSTVSAVTAEVVGVHRVSPAFSLICIMLVAPTTFADAAALSLSDHSGYQDTQIFVACMFVAGSAFLWLLRSWQLFTIEQRRRLEQDTEASHHTLLSTFAYLNWISLRKLFQGGRV